MFLAEVTGGTGNLPLEILGSLGGIVAFGVAVIAIIKAILRQVSATESNTEATKDNTAAIEALKDKTGNLERIVDVQAERIAGQATDIADLRRVVFNGGSHGNKINTQ